MLTIAAWNLVLQVVITVLVVAYGIWLKFILSHQLKAKDATIESLQTQITGLKQELAPAIVEKYQTMRQHAEEMTEENRRLAEEVGRVSGQLSQIKKVFFLAGQGAGLVQANHLMAERIGKQLFTKGAEPSLTFVGVAYLQASEELNARISQATQEANGLLRSMQ